MVGVQERVAFLEGRAVEQSTVLAGVRDAMRSLEQRFESLERSVNSRLDAMDAKMSRQFAWLTGMLVTGLLGMVAALLTR